MNSKDEMRSITTTLKEREFNSYILIENKLYKLV